MTYADARKAVLATHAASNAADDEAKERARKAAFKLRKADEAGFAYNALLNLLHRGARPTEANILSESRAIDAAIAAFHSGQRTIREGRHLEVA